MSKIEIDVLASLSPIFDRSRAQHMADTLTNELLLEILSGNANSPRPVELGEIERLTPELLASLRGLARKTMQDRDKLKFYKESFSTLTTHLNLLTARLTTAETGLQAQTTEFARQAQKNSEEVDAFRTLSKVWENRWREERREKEELESMLYAQDTTSLNRSTARDQAGITIHRSPIKPTKGRRRSPSSSSSSSSESRRDPSRSLIVASGSTRSTTRLSSKQVIADLSRELERVRRDGESLLRERDDQIDRLQHERQLRKTELKDVYLSFDTLLGLGGAVALNTPANLLVSEETTPRPKPVKVKSGRSARLKAEVQEMEQEVARLLSLKQTPPSPREQLLLSSTLQVLEYDIAQLQADLREGLHERDVLRKRLFGSANHIGTSSVAALDSTTDSRRTAKLEDANERLLAQLTATTREAAALQARLDETETTFDGIADRVRETMIKRQDDLRDASSRILLLEERLAENANRFLVTAARYNALLDEIYECDSDVKKSRPLFLFLPPSRCSLKASKMGLVSLLKKHSKDSSESATPSLVDHSDASPAHPTHSDAHSTHSTPSSAKFILESESGEKHTASTIGSGTMDQHHPAAIHRQDGTTLTSIPATDGNHVTEIISSGAKVTGEGGYDVGATDKLVGESKGVNPELVVMTESTSDTASTANSWLGKIGTVFTKDKPADDDAQSDGFGRVAALNAVAPPSATGMDLSSIGLEDEKNRNRVAGQDFIEKKEKAVPTLLVATSTLNTANSIGGGSLAETITDEFDASPVTTNEKFHAMFPLIPVEETLIEDYRCALSREILIQGRLFVSESFLSFRANILGWQTLSTIAFSEIVSIEKQSTALVIPNAIHVSTASSSHTFASLTNRDDAYNLISAVWKHNHPESRPVNDSGRTSFDSAGEERVKHDDENRSFVEYEDDYGKKKTFKFSKIIPDVLKIKSLRSINDDALTESQIVKKDHIEAVEAEEEQGGGAGKHAATKYDGPEFDNVVLDVALPTSPEKAFELIFKDEAFIRSFWEGPQGLKEVEIDGWSSTPPTRELHYIRPLSGSIGPKQTLCNIVDLEESNDAEKFISILTETRTPDVPSGSNFFTKTRTVFTWSAGGGTRLRITSEVEWTKVNRMLRSIIESSCIAGQKTYHTDLETAVRAHIKSHPADFLLAGADTTEEVIPEAPPAKVNAPSGNILESLMDPLILLSSLVALLLLTNLYTFFFLRRAGRIGEPQEVAQAVDRILQQFSTAYSKSPAKDMDRELESVLQSIAGLEKGLSAVKDRVVGLIAL